MRFFSNCICFLLRSDAYFGHQSHVITSSPTIHPDDPAYNAKRQSAAKRRSRDKEHVRAAVRKEYEDQIADLRRKHRYALALLKKEEGRRRVAVVEHHSLAVEVDKYRALDKGEVEQLELRRAAAASSVERAHQDFVTQLKASHDLVLQDLNNKHAIALQAAQLELGQLRTDVARLRAERDARSADSLRYNTERNALRAELLALRAQRSKATVAACVAAPCFPRH
jgi:hypothetical protein